MRYPSQSAKKFCRKKGTEARFNGQVELEIAEALDRLENGSTDFGAVCAIDSAQKVL